MSRQRPGRVVFLVLDSADPSVLVDGAARGRLPALSSLIESSLTGPVENVAGVFTVGTWFSLATGVEPTRHQRCSWVRFDPRTYTLARPDPDDLAYSTFWQGLDEAGQRVAVIDFPRLPLLRLNRGIQVVDWYPHDLVYHHGPRTIPESFAATHLAQYPADPCQGNCDRWNGGAGALGDAMVARIEAKTDLVVTLLSRHRWDHLTVCFGEAHCIGHRCWPLDTDIWKQSPEAPVPRVYGALDSAVGRLMGLLDDDVRLVLLANPGMEASWHAYDLARKGLRELNEAVPHGVGSRADSARELAPQARRMASQGSFEYPVGNGYFGVRVNLAGREKYGRIRPGNEVQAYMRELSVDMSALTDPHGEPLFDQVLHTSRHYQVDMDHALPDLMFRWKRGRTHRMAKPPDQEPDRLPRHRVGDHRPGGLYLVRHSGSGAGTGPGVRDLDIGVTLAQMSGVSMPLRDGRVIDAW